MKDEKHLLKHSFLLNKEEYKKINDKISTSFKDYFYLMKRCSYEINYIEEIINSCFVNKKFKIKNFIENQQLLIKDLVNIINTFSQIQIYSNREYSKTKKSMKELIRNNNTNVNYLQQKSKTNDKQKNLDMSLILNNKIPKNKINTTNSNKKERIIKLNLDHDNNVNGDLSFLNIKIPRKKNIKINQSVKASGEIENNKVDHNFKNDCSKSSIKSSVTTNIVSTKNKSYINNSSSFISNNDINNVNNNYIKKNSNRTITSYNNKINLKKKKNSFKFCERNITYNSKSFSTTTNDKNRSTRSNKNNSHNKIKIKYLNINSIIKNNDSKYYTNINDNSSKRKRKSIQSSVLSDSVSDDIPLIQEKNKSKSQVFKDIKKINNKKYEIVRHFQITPNRLTKEMLNVSYSIINKYEQKRKKTSLGKRSKSLLI
jgi:hypothetical protein